MDAAILAGALATIVFLTVPLVHHYKQKKPKHDHARRTLQNVLIDVIDPKHSNQMMYVHWSTGEVDMYLQDRGPYYPKDSPFGWRGSDGKELDYHNARKFIEEWKRAKAAKKFEDTINKIVTSQ